MTKKIYLSPSNHGVNQNKCKHSGCYEDKHTRLIADAAAKYLKINGFNVVVADKNRSVINRCLDANKLGVDLYIPIHTNASSSSSARYLLFMAWDTVGEYNKIYNCFKNKMGKLYNGDVQFWKRRDLIEINTPKAKSFYLELGFHTNQKDCDNYIHNADARGKELAKAICDYYGVTFKETDIAPVEPVKKKVISEDGVWGINTTKYTQKFLGTYADGIVSGQRTSCKKYLPAAQTISWEFKALGSGSAMVKALQSHVGLTGKNVDGLAGYNTIVAMQKFLKNKGLYIGAIDGIMGYATVVAWQKYINSKF